MDKKVIQRSIGIGVLLLFAFGLIAFVLPKQAPKTLELGFEEVLQNKVGESNKASSGDAQPIDSTEINTELDFIAVDHGVQKKVPAKMKEDLGDKYLVIKKPSGYQEEIKYEDLYMTKSIKLILPNISYDFSASDIARINGKEEYYGNPIFTEINVPAEKDGAEPTIIQDYGNDLLHNVATVCSDSQDQSEKIVTELILELDNVYVHRIFVDEDYYYIGLKKPKDVYNKVIVIDAGHGGKDAGAVSLNKQIYEKDLNIKILNFLKEMLDLEDIKVYYTRFQDEQVYLRPRVSLANAVDSDFFISIHHNASTVQSPNGSEIYYYDWIAKGISNRDLAQIFNEEVAAMITLRNRGIQKKTEGDIFILDKALVPTILIEVGYMTNYGDLDFITKNENQMKVARGIYNGVIRTYEELFND